MFDEVKDQMLKKTPDIYRTDVGTINMANPDFLEPRLKAGLARHDIEAFWNQPLMVVMCELKMKEMIGFVILDVARQQGSDVSVAAREYRRSPPQYGEPASWDPNAPFNQGFNEDDAPLFVEFSPRVDIWLARRTDKEVSNFVALHGTINAVIRQMIALQVL